MVKELSDNKGDGKEHKEKEKIRKQIKPLSFHTESGKLLRKIGLCRGDLRLRG
jgi:hypothetical protein